MRKTLQKNSENNKNISKKRKNAQKKVKNGIKIAIHPLTFIFAIFCFWCGALGLFLTYFLCLIIHEFSHYLVAKKLGYFCDRIIIYPSGALLCGDTDEFSFRDEILISIAGPLINIIMAIFCVFMWWIYPEIYNYTADFLVSNLVIAFFNLLPIFPLDGGRVVLAILSLKSSRKLACDITKKITLIFALILFAIFVASLFFEPNFQIGISSILVFVSVMGENKQAVYKRIAKSDLKRRKLSHGVKVCTLMFDKSVTLARVVSKIDNFAFYTILVVDENFKICASLTEMQIFDYAQKFSLTSSIGEIVL